MAVSCRLCTCSVLGGCIFFTPPSSGPDRPTLIPPSLTGIGKLGLSLLDWIRQAVNFLWRGAFNIRRSKNIINIINHNKSGAKLPIMLSLLPDLAPGDVGLSVIAALASH